MPDDKPLTTDEILAMAPLSLRDAVRSWDAGLPLASWRVHERVVAPERETLAQDAVVNVVRKVLDEGGVNPVVPLMLAQVRATTRVVLFANAFLTGIEWEAEDEQQIRAVAGTLALAGGWRHGLRALAEIDATRLFVARRPRADSEAELLGGAG